MVTIQKIPVYGRKTKQTLILQMINNQFLTMQYNLYGFAITHSNSL